MAASTSAAAQCLSPAEAGHELVISRLFDAPRALVFKCWTDPQHAAMWWGPQGFTLEACKMDVRVGGAWRMGMRSPEGTRHVKSGIYREVVPPERLIFTFAWEDEAGNPKHAMLVEVSFAEEGEKTRLTLRHTNLESEAARELHRGGWTSTMERFAAYLASVEARR
jgi:uncharacterized protein YndB with AHSA1/START domain